MHPTVEREAVCFGRGGGGGDEKLQKREAVNAVGMAVMASTVALSAFLLIRYTNGEVTEPSQPTEVPPSTLHDTVFLAEPNQKETPLSVYEDQSNGTYVLDKPLTIVSGSVDTQAIVARRQRTDSILNAREQGKDQAQKALT